MRVCVYNRNGARAEAWLERYPGRAAPTPREAAAGAEVVALCVGNDDDVRSAVYGTEGVLAGLAQGSLLIDHTTASAVLARELAEACAARGWLFSMPPFPGGKRARRMAPSPSWWGRKQPFARAQPFLEPYARAARRLGPVGSGQLTKMVNQICIAGILQGLSEALAFAERAGLDGEAVLSVISKGAAQSWQMENRGTMLENRFDFGFAVDWMRKDLAIALDEARRNGAQLSLTALVDQCYAAVQEQDGGRWVTSSLITLLRKGSWGPETFL